MGISLALIVSQAAPAFALKAKGDFDRDGITNAKEKITQTNPRKADTDDDGLDNGDEFEFLQAPRDPDSDNDGVEDGDKTRTDTGW